MKKSSSTWPIVAGLLVALALAPQVARAQSGPALAPYPFKPSLTPPDTRVTFRCTIEGAMLYIDGVYRGVLPLSYDLQLSVGEHSVLMKAEGHRPLKTTINVPAVVHKRYAAEILSKLVFENFVSASIS